MSGCTLMLSCGSYGGFYVVRGRVCLGWVAVTWIGFDVDDVLEAGVDALGLRERPPDAA